MSARVVVLSDAGFAEIFARVPGAALRPDDPSVQAQNDAPHVARAIAAAGHHVRSVVARSLDDVAAAVDDDPDLVVNLCDSLGGDPAQAAAVAALLDRADVRHTGGDAAAVQLGKAKHRVKEALVAAHLPTPRFQVVEVHKDPAAFTLTLTPPVIVKLAGEHASVGIDVDSVCFDVDAVRARLTYLRRHFAPQAVVVEEFVGGREFYVSCIGRPLRALPLMEHHFRRASAGITSQVDVLRGAQDVDFRRASAEIMSEVDLLRGAQEADVTVLPFRTFDKKWTDRDVVVDARFSAVPLRASAGAPRYGLDDVHDLAALALDEIGWRDWGRVDLRLDRGGVPLIIDVTPMTYLHPEAPCAKAAAAAGLSYEALWDTIVTQALAPETR